MPAAGGRRTTKTRSGADYYPTPAWATEALLEYEDFHGPILEPCCGEGYMADVFHQYEDIDVIASDKFDYGYGMVKDAFKWKSATNIVTNPPFNIAEDLARHFIKIADRKVALLLRLSFLESAKRYKFFEKHPPTKIYVFSERLSLFPANKKQEGGGTIAYAWFIWDKDDLNCPWAHLHWIEPGFKRKGLR